MSAQDVVAGDGTTSVTILCGSLLSRCMGLLEKGVHPTLVSEAFQLAADKACEVLKSIAIPVDLKDRDSLISAAMTCVPCGFKTFIESTATLFSSLTVLLHQGDMLTVPMQFPEQ